MGKSCGSLVYCFLYMAQNRKSVTNKLNFCNFLQFYFCGQNQEQDCSSEVIVRILFWLWTNVMNICYLVRRAHIIIDIDKIWSMLWQSDCTLDERCQIWYLMPIHIDGFHTIMRNTLGRDSDYDVFINSQDIGGSYHPWGYLDVFMVVWGKGPWLLSLCGWVWKGEVINWGRWSKVWNWSSVSRPPYRIVLTRFIIAIQLDPRYLFVR